MSLTSSFTSGVGAGLAPHAIAAIVGVTPTPTTLEARELAAQAAIARHGGGPRIPWVWITAAGVIGFVLVQVLSQPTREQSRRGDTVRQIV